MRYTTKNGATIHVFRVSGQLEFQVVDANGETIATVRTTLDRGWDLLQSLGKELSA